MGADDFLLKFWGYHNPIIPTWQRWLLKHTFPVLKLAFMKGLNLTPDVAAQSLKTTKKFFEEIDDRLSDGRRFLMGTDEPTHVDVSLASVGAFLVMPQEYAGKTTFGEETRVKEGELTKQFLKERLEFLKTPSGKFISMMYKNYRIL